MTFATAGGILAESRAGSLRRPSLSGPRGQEEQMAADKVRWGVLGPGRIAEKVLGEGIHAGNASFVAVASRDRSRARSFAERFEIPKVHDSYEALLADPGVDALYIATPNSLHHSMTMRALAAGKHVLCEKPYTRHPNEVVEAFDAAEAKGLVLMEAFMWRHTPEVKRFLELLPEIGELRSIRSTFAFAMETTQDVRLEPGLDGGSLMDVGCYCVSGSRLVAGTDPVSVEGEQKLGSSKVDVEFSGLLRFPSGVVAQIGCGFTYDHRSLEAIGSRDTLRMRDPWLAQPAGLWLGDREITVATGDRYRLEIENMGDAILGRGRPLLGRADALGQARTIDALYQAAASGGRVTLA
jgi:xylose dehydrogenase (NAD/NADP)